MRKLSLLFSFVLVFRLLSGALGAQETSKPAFDIKPEWLHNDDLSESTAALSWEINWSSKEAKLPSWAYGISFHSHGTLAVDEDSNHSPLVAELDANAFRLIGEDRAIKDAKAGFDNIINERIPDMTETRFHPLLLQAGISARYETDQSLDHCNGVGAAFVELSNNNTESYWALIPTFRVSLDGVAPDENETADEMNADIDSHFRFRALAHWTLNLHMLGNSDFLDRSVLSVTVEYSHDFGVDQKLEDAGQDEAFGAAIEYAYDISKSRVRPTLDNKAVTRQVTPAGPPCFIFVRLEVGNFAPQPEDSTMVLAGLRFGMGDMVKLLSH